MAKITTKLLTNKENFNIIVSSSYPVFYTNKKCVDIKRTLNNETIDVEIRTHTQQQEFAKGTGIVTDCSFKELTDCDPLFIRIYMSFTIRSKKLNYDNILNTEIDKRRRDPNFNEFEFRQSINEDNTVFYNHFKIIIKDSNLKSYLTIYKLFKDYINENISNNNIIKQFQTFYLLNTNILARNEYIELARAMGNNDTNEFIKEIVRRIDNFKIVQVKFTISEKNVIDTFNYNVTGRRITVHPRLFEDIFVLNSNIVDNELYVFLMGLTFGFAHGFKISDSITPWAHMVKYKIIESQLKLTSLSLTAEDIKFKLHNLELLFRNNLFDTYTNNQSRNLYNNYLCRAGNVNCIINMLCLYIQLILGSAKLGLDSLQIPSITIYKERITCDLTYSKFSNYICKRKHDNYISVDTVKMSNDEIQNRKIYTNYNQLSFNSDRTVAKTHNDIRMDANLLKIFQIANNVNSIIQLQYYETSNMINRNERTTFYTDFSSFNENVFNDSIKSEFLLFMTLPRIIPALAVGTIFSVPNDGSSKRYFLESASIYEEYEPCFKNKKLYTIEDLLKQKLVYKEEFGLSG